MTWIRVTQQLPNPSEDVIVIEKFSGVYPHYKYVARYEPRGRIWYTLSPKGNLERVEVTHWMPLPEIEPAPT